MSFAEQLYTKLNTDVTVLGGRIYPNNFKQDADSPKLRYAKIAAVPYHQMGVDASIERQTYQIDIVGKTYAELQTVYNAVKASLLRWREPGVVQDTYFKAASEEYDQESMLHRARLDYIFIVEV